MTENEKLDEIVIDNKKIKNLERRKKFLVGYFNNKNNTFWAVGLSLLIGVLVSLILFDYKIGINYFIFSLVILVATGYIMYRDKNLNRVQFIFWGLMFLAFASVTFRLKSYTPYAILCLPFIYIMMTIYASNMKKDRPVLQYFYRLLTPITAIGKFFEAISPNENSKKARKTWINILVGIGISTLLLCIIIPLMLNADRMFDKTMSKYFENVELYEIIPRVIVSSIVTITFFAFIFTITIKKNMPKRDKEKNQKVFSGEVTVITVLGAIGLIYTLFAMIQFKYLFIGVGTQLPEGYSYADYAVSGYFEQVFLTIINFIIISICVFLTRRSKGGILKTVNIMLNYFIGLNVYLLASAGYKMYLYQNAFGFTFERAMVYVLLFFQVIMLALLVVKIFNRKFEYIKYIIYTGVVFFAIVSFINLEAFSVNQNIERYERTGELDTRYITRGCKDTSVQVRDFYLENYPELSDEDREGIERSLKVYNHQILNGEALNKTTQRYKGNSWLEFNISDYNRYICALDIIDFMKTTK